MSAKIHITQCHSSLNFKCLMANHARFNTKLDYVSVTHVHAYM